MICRHCGGRHIEVLEAWNLKSLFLLPLQVPFALMASAPLCAFVCCLGNTCLHLPMGCGRAPWPWWATRDAPHFFSDSIPEVLQTCLGSYRTFERYLSSTWRFIALEAKKQTVVGKVKRKMQTDPHTCVLLGCFYLLSLGTGVCVWEREREGFWGIGESWEQAGRWSYMVSLYIHNCSWLGQIKCWKF
jgi:hypothetical protein